MTTMLVAKCARGTERFQTNVLGVGGGGWWVGGKGQISARLETDPKILP